MTALLALGAAGVGSWALRASFIALMGSRSMSPGLQRALVNTRHSVFAALIATVLVGTNGETSVGIPLTTVLAIMVSVAVAWRTKSVTRTVVVGTASALIFNLV